jgi:hypothetical protein
MSATTISPRHGGKFDFPMAAVDIATGEICCINAAGYMTYGQIATGLVARGVAVSGKSNSGGAPGDESITVLTSIDADGGRVLVPLDNAPDANACDQADVGRSVYVFNKNSVSGTSNGGTRSRAGKCWGFLPNGKVLVEFDGDQDADAIDGVQDQLDDLELLVAACPGMQAANATLALGTVTINTGIVVASNSEVVPLLIGAITGSTNFASLRELKASRVNGAAGVGTLVIDAVGADGAKDADATGVIRVLIFTPTA